MADIGEKQMCTFGDLLSNSNIDLLPYQKYG